MENVLILIGLGIINLIGLIVLLTKRAPDARPDVNQSTQLILNGQRTLLDSLSREALANRDEFGRINHANIEQIVAQMQGNNHDQVLRLSQLEKKTQDMTDRSEQKIDKFMERITHEIREMRRELLESLNTLRKENNQHLDKVRETVDEKLQKTLEQRLGLSFQLVNESLERVQKGLGEMQTLASGVGDLKKVLSNVKTRGVLGEMALGHILEQLLAPGQYELNVATIPDSSNYVEFAIKFPGHEHGLDQVWLPIDSKFPMDKYANLIDAYEHVDTERVDLFSQDLLRTVRMMAKQIRDKYLAPPYTTDFGILFLPVEGLYAEIVRHPSLIEELQREFKIIVAGPTNLAAFLNALQLGFRTLAIEQRSSEVWELLSKVKTEFNKFGTVVEKVKQKLDSARHQMEDVSVRSRAIERKLRKVEELPAGEPTNETVALSDQLEDIFN